MPCDLLDPYRNLALAAEILREQHTPGDDWLPEPARVDRPRRTLTGLPGLFVAGMPQYGGRGSDTLAGVWKDATTIAQHIINRP